MFCYPVAPMICELKVTADGVADATLMWNIHWKTISKWNIKRSKFALYHASVVSFELLTDE